MKQVVYTDQAPRAIGPYSQAIKANGLLFISGQLPVDPATGETAEGGVAEQTRQSLENLKAILVAENLTFANVVKTTVFLKDIKDFAAMNDVYGACFTKEPPARICVQVAKLPKDALVEIDLIAAY
jgi:2-iminobutanoate/2-iminopropanoate deaminase